MQSTHRAVMKWVPQILRKRGLADGRRVCIEAITLQAKASMQSLVWRDTGQAYGDYQRQLAAAEGIEQPTQEQRARLDCKREKKLPRCRPNNPRTSDCRARLA
jgi:hypothetical protein